VPRASSKPPRFAHAITNNIPAVIASRRANVWALRWSRGRIPVAGSSTSGSARIGSRWVPDLPQQAFHFGARLAYALAGRPALRGSKTK
jgi:hypothetical protein